MPDLLLELRSEEIPARMQRKAAGDLRKMVTDGLVDAGLTYEAAREYWTPRRLTLDIRGVTARSRDVHEEIKGPSTSAPEQAVQGFLRKAGLSDISQAEVQNDPKKGDFYVARLTKPGRAAEEIIADLIPSVIRAFPWPKSMRWGKASAKPGALRWVRPLQSIVCTFGPETEEPVVVDFEVSGIRSGNITYGHRFLAPESFIVRRFDDYAAKLETAKVIIDAERRKEIIRTDAANLAFANGLELVEDEGLLEEVSGLVEWPVVLMGNFEKEFLAIPAEVIRLTIRANQKCFVTRPSGDGENLSNHFILTSNIEAKDGGAEIAHGNGKVVRARLSDALYFWQTDQHDLPDLETLSESAEKFGLDLSKPLDQRMARLDKLGVTFHAKLGTQGQRVARIRLFAERIAELVGADRELTVRAAALAKADLQTEVVGEFPELQGVMGRKYALLQGEPEPIAITLEDHYKPQGPSDSVPTDRVAIAVALADKLDTLVGFWSINEKPTGSKDPYALRRAALGVIRIILEQKIDLRNRSVEGQPALLALFVRFAAFPRYLSQLQKHATELEAIRQLSSIGVLPKWFEADQLRRLGEVSDEDVRNAWALSLDLLAFFHDRLKVYLRDQGARHDLIDAVITPEADDLLAIVRRVEALGIFLDSEDGKNLLAGTKRAANILAAEEKKGTRIADAVDPSLLKEDAEKKLAAAVNRAEKDTGQAIQNEDFSAAMRALSALREPVDSFFEAVLVNDPDENVRANRLALLARIRAATGQVADFSRIGG